MKIAVLGKKQSIIGFLALGANIFNVESQEMLEKAKQEIENDDYAVVFLTEEIYEEFNCEEMLNSSDLPVLIIPGAKGPSGSGQNGLKKILERALGSEMNI